MSGFDACSLKSRLLAAAVQMRDLATDLNAQATLADAQPMGYSDAYRMIVAARDLGALAHRLDACAREMQA